MLIWMQGDRGEVYSISGCRRTAKKLVNQGATTRSFYHCWNSVSLCSGLRIPCVCLQFLVEGWVQSVRRSVIFSYFCSKSHFWWNLNSVFCQGCKRSEVFYTTTRFNTSILYWSKIFFAFLVNETMILYSCLQK